jgi:hypothetical protein
VRTHPVDKLLEQHCYKSAAGLLQLVRFYVCSLNILLKQQSVTFWYTHARSIRTARWATVHTPQLTSVTILARVGI